MPKGDFTYNPSIYTHGFILRIKGYQLFRKRMWYVTHNESFGSRFTPGDEARKRKTNTLVYIEYLIFF